MHQYWVNKYILSKHLKQSALTVGSGWNLGEISRLCGRQLKRPDGHKCWASNKVLQVVDAWRNADDTMCQQRRLKCSSSAGTLVCGHSTVTASLKIEEHPVKDVKPVKLVVQYLTQAAVKLPSASDDTCSSVQHAL